MEANNLKILAIDDNKDSLATLKAVVLDALPGCALLTALNEPQGVELARTEDPDVILLEGVMTGMDGYAVCRTLKRDERLRDIPVVFLTAPRTDRDSCVKALEAGAEAFLTQPLGKQELVAQVPAMARLKAANQLRRLEKEQLAALVAERTRELEQMLAERVRAEEALRESEDSLSATQRIAHMGSWEWDFISNKVTWSYEMYQLFGINPDTFDGNPESVLKWVHPDDKERFVKNMKDNLSRGVALPLEYRVIHLDGTEHTLYANGIVVFDKVGNPVKNIGTVQDITERKQAEEVLRENEANLTALIENTKDRIWTVDADYRLIVCNSHLMQGVPEELKREIAFGKSMLLDSLPQAVQDEWRSCYDRALRGESFSIEKETQLNREPKFIDYRFHPIGSAEGKISGVVVSGRDITERKQKEEALRETQRQVQFILGVTKTGLDIIDARFNLRFVDPQWAKAYGNWEGQKCYDYFQSRSDPCPGCGLPKAFGTKQMTVTENILVKEGNRPTQVTTIPYQDKNGEWLVAELNADIAERKQAEAALRESEQRFRMFIENAPVAISVSREGKTIYGNDAFLRIFGVTAREQIVGRPIIEQVAPNFSKEVADRAMRRSRGEPAEDEYEMMAMRLDGTQFPCRVAAAVLSLADGPATMAFFYDTTAQKESEKKLEDYHGNLRKLAVHLLHAREEERKKVAREIHDELGQILTALKMDLQWIGKRIAPNTTQVMEKIHDVIGLADQTIQMVHRISSELRPGMLDDLGLAAAIEWLGADFSRRNGITCRVDITAPESNIGGNSSTALFRIVQEALTNVARHAHASRASVELWEADGTLTIRVKDDGRGVTEEQSTSPLSFGLIGIRERVQGLGGEMSILGRPGEGTILEVTIPLPSAGALP